MHVSTYTHIYVYICIFVCMYVCVYSIYIYTVHIYNICMYIYIYTHTHLYIHIIIMNVHAYVCRQSNLSEATTQWMVQKLIQMVIREELIVVINDRWFLNAGLLFQQFLFIIASNMNLICTILVGHNMIIIYIIIYI